jgi:hypothetical protein
MTNMTRQTSPNPRGMRAEFELNVRTHDPLSTCVSEADESVELDEPLGPREPSVEVSASGRLLQLLR